MSHKTHGGHCLRGPLNLRQAEGGGTEQGESECMCICRRQTQKNKKMKEKHGLRIVVGERLEDLRRFRSLYEIWTILFFFFFTTFYFILFFSIPISILKYLFNTPQYRKIFSQDSKIIFHIMKYFFCTIQYSQRIFLISVSTLQYFFRY